MSAEDAFTLGLLHDIGALVTDRTDLCESEIVELGARLLDGWSLPEPIVRALRMHSVSDRGLADKFARVPRGRARNRARPRRAVRRRRGAERERRAAHGGLAHHVRTHAVLASIERELTAVSTVLTRITS